MPAVDFWKAYAGRLKERFERTVARAGDNPAPLQNPRVHLHRAGCPRPDRGTRDLSCGQNTLRTATSSAVDGHAPLKKEVGQKPQVQLPQVTSAAAWRYVAVPTQTNAVRTS